jgi:SAM-dependent methyltransferase
VSSGATIAAVHRTTCRLCGSADVDVALPLAATPPADAYVPAAKTTEVQERFGLDLYLCRACGHAQLLDVVDPKVLFSDYLYVTTSSPGLVEHFRKYADAVFGYAGSPAGGLVVDIGSNDGTLLGFFRDKGMRVLGVDAADNVARRATASGIETVSGFFTVELGSTLRRARGAAALVTANNVFAHADDLGDVADGVRALLADDGLFVFEVSYLRDLVQGKVFDYIYHEHLCYHSVRPLQQFLAAHGLHLVEVERIATKGGSLRCFAQPAGGPRAVSPSVARLIAEEDELGLQRLQTFKQLDAEISVEKSHLQALLGELRAAGKTVAGYGASATVTTLLYQFDLGSSIDFIVDDNVARQGLFSPGLHIPVLAPAVLYERKPDYVVILAWRFADLVVKQHQRYLDQGGRFIVPLPALRIL